MAVAVGRQSVRSREVASPHCGGGVGRLPGVVGTADLADLQDRLERFEDRYNPTARPFDRRFTHRDLTVMLDRVDTHQPRPEVAVAV